MPAGLAQQVQQQLLGSLSVIVENIPRLAPQVVGEHVRAALERWVLRLPGNTPGDVIPGTRGRRIDLTVSGSQGARAAVVVGVNWNLRQGICKTELLLDTPMLKVLP